MPLRVRVRSWTSTPTGQPERAADGGPPSGGGVCGRPGEGPRGRGRWERMGFERLGAGWRPRERRRQADGSLRAVRATAVVLGGVYLGSLLATALGATGVWGLSAGGGQLLVVPGVVLIMLLRARRSRADRAAWLCFAGAIAAYLGGIAVYQ